jgi:hypothetical protein
MKMSVSVLLWQCDPTTIHFGIGMETATFSIAPLKTVHSKDFGKVMTRSMYDSSKVHFFVKGVDRSNAYLYDFYVMEYPSKRGLIPWKSVDRFSTNAVTR